MSMIFHILTYIILFVALPEIMLLVGLGVFCYVGCRTMRYKQNAILVVTITGMLVILTLVRVASPVFMQIHETKDKVNGWTDFMKVEEEMK